MRVYAGDEAVEALQNAGRPREYLSASQPLVRLINELTKQQEYIPGLHPQAGILAHAGEGTGRGRKAQDERS